VKYQCLNANYKVDAVYDNDNDIKSLKTTLKFWNADAKNYSVKNTQAPMQLTARV